MSAGGAAVPARPRSRADLTLPASDHGALRALWELGGPVIFQSLLASTLGLIDTLMVSGVGPAALGGVGLVSRVLFVLSMVLAGLASGTGVLVAQFGGAGRLRAVRGPVAVAVGLGILLTLPMALLSLFGAPWLARLLSPDHAVADAAATFLIRGAAYAPLTAITSILGATLRSSGDTRTTMWAGLAALGLNTVLNVLFINGNFGMPAYGVAAAAVATSCARLVEAMWLLAALAPGRLRRLPGMIRTRDARHVLRNSGPLMLKEMAWAGGVLASTLIISRMGALPLAAFNLVLPVEGIMISVVAGCGVATGILLGHALGRNAFDDAYRCAERLRRVVSTGALLVGVLSAMLVQGLRYSGWLSHLIAPELHDAALDTLSVLCLAFGARAHNTMVSVGILRSGNDSAWLFGVDLCSMWLFNVPMVAVAALVLHWPLAAVVAVMLLEEVLKVGVFRWRVKSGRWLRRV